MLPYFMRAQALLFCFAASCLATSGGCYYISEGLRLAGVYGKAVPVEAALSDEALGEDERELLLFVREVKEYAVSELGLKDNGNYTTYVRTEGTHIANVVSACAADSFDQYQFDFIAAGKLPYKGFFRAEDAIAEAKRLEKQGLDVMVRGVEAFSTLGTLRDPIMGYMKGESRERIAEVIIHEQVHATVFFSGYPDASENLATFIGRQGAIELMKAKFGEAQETYKQALALDEDSKTYTRLVGELYNELDGMYNSVLDRDTKLAKKEEIIRAWKKRISESFASLFKTDAYSRIGEASINNAYIATFRNYTSNLDLYDRLYKKTGNSIRQMISIMKDIMESKAGDPESILRDYLVDSNGAGSS